MQEARQGLSGGGERVEKTVEERGETLGGEQNRVGPKSEIFVPPRLKHRAASPYRRKTNNSSHPRRAKPWGSKETPPPGSNQAWEQAGEPGVRHNGRKETQEKEICRKES